MAEIDPYDKITELTNERNDALAKVRELEGVSARFDALKGEHESLKEQSEAQRSRLSQARKEIQEAHNRASNAESAQMRAEEALSEAEGQISDLQARLEKALRDASDAVDARDVANEGRDRVLAAQHALKGEVQQFVDSVQRHLGDAA